MSHTPLPEQQRCIDAMPANDNLLVRALAGAGKTSTLIMMAEAVPATRILCLAFNKKIADEMKSRLPPNCDSMTLNSLGYRAWRQVIPGCRVNADKMHTILTEIADRLSREEKSQFYESMSDILKACSFAKQCGYVPDSYTHQSKPRPLMGDDDFFAHLEERLETWEQDIVTEAITISLRQAWTGNLDFDDQVYMPTIFYAPFDSYPIVMIDEAQDLSALNHAMLAKLAKKRLIAVGDECQAIYGFRGAHQDSMDLLRDRFGMVELRLSTTFRCPIKIVQHAQWRAPHMRHADWAQAGEVRTLTAWDLDDLPEGAAVLCRNNAPLFSLALKMLIGGRYAEIMGNDIGKGLIKIMKKFGPVNLLQKDVLQHIGTWEAAKAEKSRNPGSIHDRAECMRIFARAGRDLGAAINYAESIFNARGPVKLATGHKSKGLEFDDVFILDEFLIGDKGQEPNLRYVMQTRAKRSLTYIETKGLILPEAE